MKQRSRNYKERKLIKIIFFFVDTNWGVNRLRKHYSLDQEKHRFHFVVSAQVRYSSFFNYRLCKTKRYYILYLFFVAKIQKNTPLQYLLYDRNQLQYIYMVVKAVNNRVTVLSRRSLFNLPFTKLEGVLMQCRWALNLDFFRDTMTTSRNFECTLTGTCSLVSGTHSGSW